MLPGPDIAAQRQRGRPRSLGSAAAALFLLAGASAACAVPGSPEEATFDYLHVEANEGNSSGGHAAIRFGNSVYDFTHHDGGLLRLRRQHANDFLHTYAFLQNRSLHVVRVTTTAAEAAALRESFAARHLAEQAQFDTAAELRADEELFGALETDPPSARVRVDGAGYFEMRPDGARTGALTELKRGLQDRHGHGIVRRRMFAASRDIASLETPAIPDGPLPASPQQLPVAPSGFARRVRDRVALLVALDVLEHARPLRPDALRIASDDALDAEDLDALRCTGDRLQDDLAALFDSSREDRGTALLVGMARLVAIRRSVETGRLAVPDLVLSDTPAIPARDLENSTDLLAIARDEARDDLAAALRELHASTGEIAWGAVELAAVRAGEFALATEHARPLHLVPDSALPARGADFAVPPLPRVPRGDAARLRAATATRRRLHDERLAALYAYSLIGRNCASELLVQMDGAAAHSAGPRGLDFIPFVSARGVAERWPRAERFEIPSWRDARLQELRSRPGSVAAVWRESNTLTSRLYRRSRDDSYFLLFADSPLVRPLAGAVNLAAGAGATVAGTLALPFDGPDTLVAGLRGMLFSLPELAFVRIRRGSFDFLDRRTVTMPPRWAEPVAAR